MEAHFILNRSKVLEQYNIVKELCDEVSYSFKTNPEVGKILEKDSDSQFSIHSLENTEKINDNQRIWMIAQGWDADEIRKLFNKGIRRFVVDNAADLNVLLDYIKKGNEKINLMLRMRMKEETVHTGKYFVFGMYSSQINEFIPKLKDNDKIEKLGIHFHRKTQNVSEWSIKYELVQILSKETLDAINIINIGGGLPSKYRNYRADVMKSITDRLKEARQWMNEKGIRMIMEPGRFIAAPSVTLVAEIKNIYDNNIIINCSVYNTCLDTFIANIKLMVKGELDKDDYKKGKAQMYTIKGCTPCSMDLFRYRVFLDDPKIGDEIIFLNAGAYNFSTDFCNLKKLKTLII